MKNKENMEAIHTAILQGLALRPLHASPERASLAVLTAAPAWLKAHLRRSVSREPLQAPTNAKTPALLASSTNAGRTNDAGGKHRAQCPKRVFSSRTNEVHTITNPKKDSNMYICLRTL